ncbi:TPA: acyltransferase family protein [Acinetobacter baumannii]
MSKINSAESIRGLACLAVVFSHFSLTYLPELHNFDNLTGIGNSFTNWLYHSPFAFFYSGTSAVFIFFVLSGYVLSYAILSKGSVNKKILSMSLKRYPRLAIPVVISCILYSVILANINIDTSKVFWLKDYGRVNSIYESVYQGLFESFLFGSSTINFVLWTMQVELLASFVIFFLLYILNNSKFYIFIFLSIACPLIMLLVSAKMFLGTMSFVIGMYIYLYGKNIPKILLFPSLILGLYFAGAHNDSNSYRLFINIFGNKTYTLFNFMSGVLIVAGVLLNTHVSKLLDNKILIYLGKISFSIYLLHTIFLYALSIPLFNILVSNGLNFNIAVIATFITSVTVLIISANYYSKFIDDFSIYVCNKLENFVFKKRNQLLN